MEKLYIATQKYLIVSPRKVRGVIALIKKLKPLEAMSKLEFVHKKSSELVVKVIKTAIGQAKKDGVSDTELVFKEIQIGEGPRLKRGHAASRGRWHPYKKRMSHIRIVLSVRNSQITNDKLQTNSNDQKAKVKKIRKVKNGTKN